MQVQGPGLPVLTHQVLTSKPGCSALPGVPCTLLSFLRGCARCVSLQRAFGPSLSPPTSASCAPEAQETLFPLFPLSRH